MTTDFNYAPTLPGIAAMMRDADEGVFTDTAAEMLEEIITAHAQTAEDTCDECSDGWTCPWPCSWWASGLRVATAWLMERAAGAQRGPLRLPPEVARRVADPLRSWRDDPEGVHKLAYEVLGLVPNQGDRLPADHLAVHDESGTPEKPVSDGHTALF